MKKVSYRKNMSVKVSTINNDPSKTDQQWEKDCNVNNIMAKFAQTGQLHHTKSRPGVYADVSELGDFQTAMNTVTQAQRDFSQLPAALRERFNQSPASLVKFLSDPNNRDEAIKLGLIPTPISDQTVPVPTEPDGDKRKRVSPKTSISSSEPDDKKSE